MYSWICLLFNIKLIIVTIHFDIHIISDLTSKKYTHKFLNIFLLSHYNKVSSSFLQNPGVSHFSKEA